MKKRRNILTLVTAGVLVLVFVLYMITYVVREGEVAVLTTFGKVTRVIEAEPGLYWKAPPPIQRVTKFDARLHTENDRLEETKTSDGVPILVLAYYNWQIAEPKLFYSRLGSIEAARQKLNYVMRDAKDDVFGQHSFQDLLPEFRYERRLEPVAAAEPAAEATDEEPAPAPVGPKFDKVELEILDRVQDKALVDYGVAITRVGIMRFELPMENTQAVIGRMRAEREREAAKYTARGKGEAAKLKTDADEDYARIIAEARGEAYSEEARGIEEEAKHYGTFALNEGLHDFLRKLEALEAIIDEGTTLILSTDSPVFELLQSLPLELLPPKSPEDGGRVAPGPPSEGAED